MVAGREVGGWGSWVTGIKEGTQNGVSRATDESPTSTSETNNTLCVN